MAWRRKRRRTDWSSPARLRLDRSNSRKCPAAWSLKIEAPRPGRPAAESGGRSRCSPSGPLRRPATIQLARPAPGRPFPDRPAQSGLAAIPPSSTSRHPGAVRPPTPIERAFPASAARPFAAARDGPHSCSRRRRAKPAVPRPIRGFYQFSKPGLARRGRRSPFAKGDTVPGPPTSSQVCGRTVLTIRSMSVSKSAWAPPRADSCAANLADRLHGGAAGPIICNPGKRGQCRAADAVRLRLGDPHQPAIALSTVGEPLGGRQGRRKFAAVELLLKDLIPGVRGHDGSWSGDNLRPNCEHQGTKKYSAANSQGEAGKGRCPVVRRRRTCSVPCSSGRAKQTRTQLRKNRGASQATWRAAAA